MQAGGAAHAPCSISTKLQRCPQHAQQRQLPPSGPLRRPDCGAVPALAKLALAHLNAGGIGGVQHVVVGADLAHLLLAVADEGDLEGGGVSQAGRRGGRQGASQRDEAAALRRRASGRQLRRAGQPSCPRNSASQGRHGAMEIGWKSGPRVPCRSLGAGPPGPWGAAAGPCWRSPCRPARAAAAGQPPAGGGPCRGPSGQRERSAWCLGLLRLTGRCWSGPASSWR